MSANEMWIFASVSLFFVFVNILLWFIYHLATKISKKFVRTWMIIFVGGMEVTIEFVLYQTSKPSFTVTALFIIFSSVVFCVLVYATFRFFHLSTRDYLTKAFNHRYIFAYIQKRMKQRNTFAVVFIDINKFKEINDSEGHQVGNELLIHFSNILKETVRRYDIVGRYGGDEFILILSRAKHDDAVRVLDRLRANLNHDVLLQKYQFQISTGIACFPDDGNDIEDILRLADQKMYAEKRYV